MPNRDRNGQNGQQAGMPPDAVLCVIEPVEHGSILSSPRSPYLCAFQVIFLSGDSRAKRTDIMACTGHYRRF